MKHADVLAFIITMAALLFMVDSVGILDVAVAGITAWACLYWCESAVMAFKGEWP